ncbi:hypothetical protein B0J11DRAFT_272576 [Dendryphion nanum]|uniref:Uncharacterized protein n=1 Tax=Dendryphion nanum TaxID=256645 RepID=A0A9P9IRG4_9PLEO|nr:hypothetical protein B0J11DRAFT_272576 [Dendryphion nanum]
MYVLTNLLELNNFSTPQLCLFSSPIPYDEYIYENTQEKSPPVSPMSATPDLTNLSIKSSNPSNPSTHHLQWQNVTRHCTAPRTSNRHPEAAPAKPSSSQSSSPNRPTPLTRAPSTFLNRSPRYAATHLQPRPSRAAPKSVRKLTNQFVSIAHAFRARTAKQYISTAQLRGVTNVIRQESDLGRQISNNAIVASRRSSWKRGGRYGGTYRNLDGQASPGKRDRAIAIMRLLV